jgi:hypothetical protein
MTQPIRHTHDSIRAAELATLEQLNSDKINLMLALDKLVLEFHRKYPVVSIDLKVSKFHGDPQVIVILAL